MTRSTVLYFDLRDLVVEQEAELEAAASRGLSVVLATATPGPAATDPRVASQIRVRGTDLETQANSVLAELQRRELHIAAVVAWKDAEVPLAARVAQWLDLPFSSVAAADRVRHKGHQRLALDTIDGVNPPFHLVNDELSLRSAVSRVGAPALLKPAGASGAKGIFPVDTAEMAVTAYLTFREHTSPDRDPMFRHFAGEAVYETRLEGTEHSIGGIVGVDGVIHVVAIADKRLDVSIPLEYQNAVPSTLDSEAQLALTDMTRRAVEALGIGPGGFHVDAMWTPDGPRILEVGARLGGYCINSTVVPAVMGTRPYELLLRTALGERIDPEHIGRAEDAPRRAGMRLVLAPTTGTVKSLSGFADLARDPSVLNVVPLAQPGSRMLTPPQAYKSYALGYFVAMAPVEVDFDRHLDHLSSLVTADVE